MSTVALLLALLAAVMHATWNLFLKDSVDRTATVALMGVIGAAIYFPWVLASTGLPVGVWDNLLLSSVIHSVYYLALVTAYERVDFSVAYPVARGMAPALVAVGGWAFLGDRLSAAEIAAVAVIVLALIGLARTPGTVTGLEWAGLTGVMIALYTVIDAAAVRESGEALAYTVTLTAVSTGLLLSIALSKRGLSGVVAAARAKPIALGVASMLNIGAYALVLVAATRAPVGLVAAVRESSVVIGAVAGIVLFAEPFGRRRIAGAAAVAVGILALAIV